MTDKLKPCKKCKVIPNLNIGSSSIVKGRSPNSDEITKTYFFICPTCADKSEYCESACYAIAAWNKRQGENDE